MRLKWCLILLATVLLAGSSANASIVIDAFDVDGVAGDGGATSTTQLLTNGIERTLSVTTSSDILAIDGGAGSMSATLASGSAFSLSYDLTGGGYTGARNFFVDKVLQLGITSSSVAAGTPDFTLNFSATSAGATTAFASLTGLSTIPSAIDMLAAVSGAGGNGHLAAFSSVDELTIEVVNNSTGLAPVGIFLGSGGIVAVPEPTTMALLTPLMLGGVFYRRRKTKEADQAKI
ncbi:PEP-CTERM sorting domain-containing protein [bacterium]|nr:PEP-CTERM sorting domain-containing protein [bacterium]